MQIILSILLIILSIITTNQSNRHQKYKETVIEYIDTLKEGRKIQKELISAIERESDYYKKAYEDTILEHIKLMKINNRRNIYKENIKLPYCYKGYGSKEE